MKHSELFATLAAVLATEHGDAADDAADDIVTARVVANWLRSGPRVFDTGPDRDTLDELCRQIDVRKRVSRRYTRAWKRVQPEAPASPAVIAGVVAILVANGDSVGAAGNDGWGLKCANSALKAIDLWADLPEIAQLRVGAAEVLDRVADRTGES